MTFTPRRGATVVVMSLAFVLAGCSSDENTDASASPTPAQAGGVVAAILEATPTQGPTSTPEPMPTAAPTAVPTSAGPSPEAGADGYPSAEAVREAYITAYEANSFAPILKYACPEYVTSYGTGTSSLEQQLSAYQVTATAVGEAKTLSDTRENLQIDLQLRSGNYDETVSLNVIATKQADGAWRYCGESEA